ncbi:MAG: hypothetical protein AAB630_00780 [Patescibacteria group bacterium]
MKKILGVLLLMLTLVVTTGVSHGAIWIVPTDMPEWAVNGLNGTHYWFTDQYAYGVGVSSPTENSSPQSTAKSRARVALITGLQVKMAVNAIEIRRVYIDPYTKKVYALARMPIKVVPAK